MDALTETKSASRFSSSSALAVGGLLAVVLLTANVALTFVNVRRLNEDTSWVSHTHEVVSRLESVLALVEVSETEERSFVITGEPRSLRPYQAAVDRIGRQVDELETMTADNPRQQGRFPALRESVASQLQQQSRIIALRRDAGFDAARQAVLADQGRRHRDGLRAIIDDMTRHERGLLEQRSLRSRKTYRVALGTGLFSGLASLAAVGAFLVLLRRHLSSRARTSAVIAEQGEMLRTTLASIGDAVITTDTAGRVTNLNAVAEELTGWTTAGAAGQPLAVVFHIVNEDTREVVANPATRALSEGVIVGLANHTILLARDGREWPIDDSAAPIRNRGGEVIGCVLVFRDVTERRRAETELKRAYAQLEQRLEQLAESEARFRNMADSAPVMIWITDAEGLCTYLNKQWYDLTGTTEEEGLGLGWLSSTHPDDRTRAGNIFFLANEKKEPFRLEYRLRQADGSYRWAIDSGSPRFGAGGEFLGYIGSVLDIEERKVLEDDLRQLAASLSEAGRRKDEFLATLAHELRNPLAPIRNGLQILKLARNDEKAMNQARTMMERQLAQMVRLVDDLLDVSRITRDKLELRKERVALSTIVGSAVETCRPLIEASGHELTVSLPEEPIYLDADLTRLAQVFSNLLNNAAKYTERGGRIELSAAQEGPEAVVRITDTGAGIPAAMLPRVFDLFTQVDQTLERAQGGLGIGLTLVRRLVTMHGGTVQAFSEGPGQGSELVVRLPVFVPREPTAEDALGGMAAAAPLHRILVVDDNQDAALSLEMLLRLTGHETRIAYDGLAAMEAAADFRPDIVLLDIGLPKLNGYEVARRIREQPWGKTMGLVALTGWGQEDDRRRSREAGFNRHLVKPVDPGDLSQILIELSRELGPVN